MSDEQLMITTFTKAYNKYIYNEMVIGQLAHTELKDKVKTGIEVDLLCLQWLICLIIQVVI